jgi:hypothetical protein
LAVSFLFATFVASKHAQMNPVRRIIGVVLLLAAFVVARADSERIFRAITASDGLADNSAQTIKCTKTGRMTITTIGNINLDRGALRRSIGNDNLDRPTSRNLDLYLRRVDRKITFNAITSTTYRATWQRCKHSARYQLFKAHRTTLYNRL